MQVYYGKGQLVMGNEKKINVVVWNEFSHERESKEIAAIYPNGMHTAIADSLKTNADFSVSTATLEEPECGLGGGKLDETNVLLWWGHMKHGAVPDDIVKKVYDRVMEGMGLIALHSSHASKIFTKLCGCNSVNLKWRETDDTEILWVVDPNHPIVKGLNKDHIILDGEEMYGEHFDIPTPDELVFISWFTGGEVFRSGLTYKRGLGKIFYFRPGHETYPTYYNKEILKVIENAVYWCAQSAFVKPKYGQFPSVLDKN